MTIFTVTRLTVQVANVPALADLRVSLDLLSDGSYAFTDTDGSTVAVDSDEALRRLFAVHTGPDA